MNNRTLKSTIERVNDNFRVILLTGMRQVGKTMRLKMLSEQERTYITLDDTATLNLAKTDPYLFFKTYQPPMLIDEIQYAPDLFPHIKILVDNSLTKGQVWLTGSQQFLLMKGVSETLAGRLVLLELIGFSIYERESKGELQKPFLPCEKPIGALKNKSLAEIYEIIWKGCFLDISLMGNDNWADFLKRLLLLKF